NPIGCGDAGEGFTTRTVFIPNGTGDGWYAEWDVACDTDEVLTGEIIWPGVPGYRFAYRNLSDRAWRQLLLRDNLCLNPAGFGLNTFMPEVVLNGDGEEALTGGVTWRCTPVADPEYTFEKQ